MKTAAQVKAQADRRRERRLAAGVCLRCGKAEPETGYRNCPACVRLAVEMNRRRYERRSRAGQCTGCGIPVIGRALCGACAKASARRAHSLTGDPRLLAPASGDYRLQGASPARNAGTDLSFTTDIVGNPIVGTPDIGAYEYDSRPRLVLP